ncbi:holin [Actinomadura sp. WMMA1423]|uniref:holin n=1 Tax=Actinomadura sp. WMMA1423 TaxID=2591108 RepID=UPI001146D78D|nr:holin [Actinomadura sp. WMMA1423]
MSAPVEAKVKTQSLATLVAGFVVAWVVVKVPALAGLADVLQAVIIGGIATAVGAVTGWLTKHTPRAPSQVPPAPRL